MLKHAELVRIDRSKPFLRQWYSQGFRAVKLKLVDTSCRVCRSMRNAEFYIFTLLRKDNPIFRVTHPNCKCGLLPVPESNIKHDQFDEKMGYKLKARELEEPTKPVVPEKEEKYDTNDKALEQKKEKIEKQIEDTEKKIEDIDKKEEKEAEPGKEQSHKPNHIKDYLNHYLQKLKDFMKKLVPGK